MTRATPSLETKLAATLLALGVIPYDDAKAMGRTNFLSLFAFDHNIRHAEDGTDEFYNLAPMLIPAHREKTRKIDVPEIAKNKRIRAIAAAHRVRLDAKLTGDVAPSQPRKRKIANRPFQKGHRPMQSRGFR